MDFGGAFGMGQMVGQLGANYYANKTAKLQADTANYIRGLNNQTREAENSRDAVLTDIQRWRQNVYNTRVKENAAKDQTTIETNFWRQRDMRQRASFSEQIRSAEEEGRMAASAAASGVTGSVVDMINNTAKLRKGMEDQQRAAAEKQFTSDKDQLEFATYWSHLDQIDYSLVFDNPRSPDFSVNTPHQVSIFNGVTGSMVKGAAQGLGQAYDFAFKPAPSTDFSGVDYQATRDN